MGPHSILDKLRVNISKLDFVESEVCKKRIYEELVLAVTWNKEEMSGKTSTGAAK